MANNPYVNKVQTAGGVILIDISDTTAVASDVTEGKYFYTADGAKVEGTSPGSEVVSVVDTLDVNGGTIRTITAVNISDTTATAADVAQGKYFYTADGTKTAGTASGGGFATGTFTPTEDTKAFTINVGTTFSHFVIYATTNVYAAGSGKRTQSLIVFDSSMAYTWRGGSNAAGSTGSISLPTTGFSISGTQFVVNTDQFFLGGYTYNWIAW